VAKQDDLNVRDDELLYRLIHPSFAQRSQQNPRVIEITSQAFKTKSLSSLRLKQLDFNTARQADAGMGRPATPHYGVAVFSAYFVRQVLGGIICVENEPEFPPDSHVVIYRDASGQQLTASQCKTLATAAHLAIPPQGVP
jgi:hypothetical protein